MEGRKHNEDFLREVDQDLLISTGELRRNGFTSTASAKYPTEKDLAGITEGNRRHNMVNCLRTSVRERLQTKFPSSSEKCRASSSVGQEAHRTVDNLNPASCAQRLD